MPSGRSIPTCKTNPLIKHTDDLTFGILHSRFHKLWSLRLCHHLGAGNDPCFTSNTNDETFPFPEGMSSRDNARKAGQATPPCLAGDILAENIAAAARHLNELREVWLNPPEWTDRVIGPEEQRAGLPRRSVARPGFEADLKKRTLTNLYNVRPAWLDKAHKALDQAVAAAYGWTDYTPEMPDDEILRRLLALSLDRAAGWATELLNDRKPGQTTRKYLRQQTTRQHSYRCL